MQKPFSRGALAAGRRNAFRKRVMAKKPEQLRAGIKRRWVALHKNWMQEEKLVKNAIGQMRRLFTQQSRRNIDSVLADLPKDPQERVEQLANLFNACMRGTKKRPGTVAKIEAKVKGMRKGNRVILAEIKGLIAQTVALENK